MIEVLSVLLIIISALLSFIGLKIYFQDGCKFYLLFSMAFLVSTTNSIISKILLYFAQSDYRIYSRYAPFIGELHIGFLDVVPLALLLLGLLLELTGPTVKSSTKFIIDQSDDHP